jgi:hypothetical protein
MISIAVDIREVGGHLLWFNYILTKLLHPITVILGVSSDFSARCIHERNELPH